jgi:hypothetical protein
MRPIDSKDTELDEVDALLSGYTPILIDYELVCHLRMIPSEATPEFSIWSLFPQKLALCGVYVLLAFCIGGLVSYQPSDLSASERYTHFDYLEEISLVSLIDDM